MSTSLSLKERFMNFVSPEPNSGCWLWTGSVSLRKNSPRGMISDTGRSRLAARVSHELFKGPIPEGHVIRHKCDLEICVNPDHLLTGTQKDNVGDRVSRNRSARLKGEKNGYSKLTESLVIKMRAAKAGGEPTRAIARRFGVSQYGARYALDFGWKHVK